MLKAQHASSSKSEEARLCGPLLNEVKKQHSLPRKKVLTDEAAGTEAAAGAKRELALV